MKKGLKLFQLLSLFFFMAFLLQCSKEEVPDVNNDKGGGEEEVVDPDTYSVTVKVGIPVYTNPDSVSYQEYKFDFKDKLREGRVLQALEETLPDFDHFYLIATDDCERPAANYFITIEKTGGSNTAIEPFGVRLPQIPGDLEIIDVTSGNPMVANQHYNFEINTSVPSQSTFALSIEPRCLDTPVEDLIRESKEEQLKMELWKNNEKQLIDFNQKVKLTKSAFTTGYSMVEFSNHKEAVRNTDNKEIVYDQFNAKDRIIVNRIHTYNKDLCSQPLAAINLSFKNQFLVTPVWKVRDIDLKSIRIEVEPKNGGSIDIKVTKLEEEEDGENTTFGIEISFNCTSTKDVNKEFNLKVFRTGIEHDGEVKQTYEQHLLSVPILVILDVQEAPGG